MCYPLSSLLNTSCVLFLTCCVLFKISSTNAAVHATSTVINNDISLSRITATSTSNNSTLKKKKSSSNVVVTVSADNDDDDHAVIANTTNVTEPFENNTTVSNNAVEKDKAEEDPIDSILSDISSWMTKHQSTDHHHVSDDSEDDYQSHQRSSGIVLRRPFVTLTYAQTLDGMIAAKLRRNETTSTNMKISSPQSLTLTHKLRRIHDAILVGGGTFQLDEPRLNVRLNSPATKSSSTSSSIPNMQQHEQPMPIVLDTHLRHLQQILFGKTFPITTENEQNDDNDNANDDDDETETPTITIPIEMSVERIRAQNPIICCSNQAAFSFLDLLEAFQDEHLQNRKKRCKTSYQITVYKKIDENDHLEDANQPIKITVYVTHHKKKEEDVTHEVTFTLLPCPLNEETKSVSLKHALDQLYDQFDIRSVMVEGGAGILSSFLNECDYEDGNSVVNCACITIAPTLLGGFGLPSLGELDTRLAYGNNDNVDDEEGGEEDVVPTMKSLDGKFIPLDRDCIFLGRL